LNEIKAIKLIHCIHLIFLNIPDYISNHTLKIFTNEHKLVIFLEKRYPINHSNKILQHSLNRIYILLESKNLQYSLCLNINHKHMNKAIKIAKI